MNSIFMSLASTSSPTQGFRTLTPALHLPRLADKRLLIHHIDARSIGSRGILGNLPILERQAPKKGMILICAI